MLAEKKIRFDNTSPDAYNIHGTEIDINGMTGVI
jgi:hypothetical protein